MCLLIQRMQRQLITGSDGPNEPQPVLLGYASLRRVGVQQIAEGWLAFTPVLVWIGRTHNPR